ncbi:MAG: hypothetical protein ABI131_08315 [Nostocoides sp.]
MSTDSQLQEQANCAGNLSTDNSAVLAEMFTAVGFVGATVEFTHEAAPGRYAAIVRASKPTR